MALENNYCEIRVDLLIIRRADRQRPRPPLVQARPGMFYFPKFRARPVHGSTVQYMNSFIPIRDGLDVLVCKLSGTGYRYPALAGYRIVQSERQGGCGLVAYK